MTVTVRIDILTNNDLDKAIGTTTAAIRAERFSDIRVFKSLTNPLDFLLFEQARRARLLSPEEDVLGVGTDE